MQAYRRRSAQSFLNSLRAVPLYKHHETPKALLVSTDGIRANAKWLFPRRALEEAAGSRPDFILVTTEDWRLKNCGLALALYRPELASHYSEETRQEWVRHVQAASKANRAIWRGLRRSSVPAGLVGGAYESMGA